MQHKQRCPICKACVGRREVAQDAAMDAVLNAFARLKADKENVMELARQVGPGTVPRTQSQRPATSQVLLPGAAEECSERGTGLLESVALAGAAEDFVVPSAGTAVPGPHDAAPAEGPSRLRRRQREPGSTATQEACTAQTSVTLSQRAGTGDEAACSSSELPGAAAAPVASPPRVRDAAAPLSGKAAGAEGPARPPRKRSRQRGPTRRDARRRERAPPRARTSEGSGRGNAVRRQPGRGAAPSQGRRTPLDMLTPAAAAATAEEEERLRRIPTRLLPWSCSACTLENKFEAKVCEVCLTPKPGGGARAQAPWPGCTAPSPDTQSGTRAPSRATGKEARGRAGRKPGAEEESRSADPRGELEVGGGAIKALGSGLSDVPSPGTLCQLARRGVEVVDTWQPGVTHVVCGVDAQGAAARTFKYLMGLASGVWVVQEAWAEAVTRQHRAQVRPVDEREYLVEGDSCGGRGAAALSREQRRAGAPGPLAGYSIRLAGTFSAREELLALAQAAGAELAPSGQRCGGSDTRCVTLCETKPNPGSQRASRHALVSPRWVTDCIGAMAPLPLDAYLLA
ncbi:hypothetical protein APUTEX25_002476 [Auxenochlorella protothecoides]|uniref:RanBP2-type domain-containing protein n=1 Tax=Auxenochlorella protothecoides TaxID=3075 RepID=A0A3M7L487_AUXPR|nr:hypothetical protein APUTEX25_002476 [Auxenochlorella protothecoides]|eukprot:RMZ56286.1 hypothetical protein APUTEX25_002476 [Auxenochlorella protothecoides]